MQEREVQNKLMINQVCKQKRNLCYKMLSGHGAVIFNIASYNDIHGHTWVRLSLKNNLLSSSIASVTGFLIYNY